MGLQCVFEVFINLHNGRLVAAAVAVVGGAEDGDDVLLVTPVVAVHHQLVGARHKCEAVVVIELLGDVLPEGVPGTTRRYAPTASIVGV